MSGFTPVEPTYPAAGGFIAAGTPVAGPDSTIRYKLTLPAYAGYTYEVYGNPTLADLEWKALPFSLSQTGAIDRHKHTATSEGSLSIYVAAAADRGFYKVSFRVPGANTGTP
jgi:protocatechuate 3,4-dioxygenase, beta subunit